MAYISKANALGYEPAKQLKTKVLASLRAYYDKMALEPRPDYRLMGKMLFTPWLNAPVDRSKADRVLNGAEGATLKTKWNDLKGYLAKFGIANIPQLIPDLGADAATLARIWCQVIKKAPEVSAKRYSLMDIDEMLDHLQDANDLNTLLLSICECCIELDDVIVKSHM